MNNTNRHSELFTAGSFNQTFSLSTHLYQGGIQNDSVKQRYNNSTLGIINYF